MNLFSILLHVFVMRSQSMVTDMRSAFANMLHHTLFGPDGPSQGEFNVNQIQKVAGPSKKATKLSEVFRPNIQRKTGRYDV